MRKRIGLTMIGAVAAVSLLMAPGASAATEVGSNCQAESGIGGALTLVQLAKVTADPLPLTTPSSGVVTRWKVNSGIEGSFPQQLKVLRQSGNDKTFLTVAESTAGTVVKGQNSFATRIPVQAGDRFGVGSSLAVLYCITGNGSDTFGFVAGNTPAGSTNEFTQSAGAIVAVSATVEPDADNDGFGDETQDQCPQSAAVQSACPVAALSVSSVVRKGFARVLVTTNTQASVTVAGTVKLGKGKKAKLAGSTQVVVPGTIAKFTLIFPEALKAKLKELSRKQSLQLALTATAANIVGAPTVSTLKAKVKGQKKPVRKAKGKGKKGGKQG